MVSGAMKWTVAAALLLAVFVLPRPAAAHWCHDLWASTYQIIVRPASDTVDVPASGNAYLDIWVQNNMGYPLEDFSISAQATNFNIGLSVIGQPAWAAAARGGYLMSGERRHYQMSVSAASASQLAFDNVAFFVGFGNGSGQDGSYGKVMNLSAGGAIASSPLDSFYAGFADSGNQSKHLAASAEANFGSVAVGLENLMLEFCSGRASWAGGAPAEPITTYCAGNGATNATSSCPGSSADGTISKYDWSHLWSAGEIAYRAGDLSSLQRDDFRARLWCSWQQDPDVAFRAFSIFVLGYVGDDAAGTYAPQISNVISNGTTEEQGLAEAALYLLDGSNATAVSNNTGSSNQWVALANSAARGIRAQDDTAVVDGVIANTASLYPQGSDNGFGLTAGHMLNIITWDRRTWAPNGYGVGSASYYQSVVDAVAPAAPQNATCAVFGASGLRATWDQVTLDVDGGAENVSSYNVYWGRVSRPGSSSQPGDGFDYDHVDGTTSIFLDPAPLTAGDTYYVAVTAVDAASNESVYSLEASCVAPTPPATPVAAIGCVPTSGITPLDINCDATGSTDANNDIADYLFSVDGGAESSEPTGLFATQLSPAGGHTVMVRVVDSTAGSDTATANITVTDPAGTNQPPIAVAAADVTSGVVPMTVNFNSTGSNDPDTGDTLSFSWDFRDGTALATQAGPTHTFTVAGNYDVTLTLSDDGTPSYSAVAVVPIVAVDPSNTAPAGLNLVTASPDLGAPPLQSHFEAGGISDAEGDRIFLDWDFGDGSQTLTGELGVDPVSSFDHTFNSLGSYTVTLTASDDGTPSVPGVTRTLTIVVTRNTPPDTTAATVNPLSGTVPLVVDLDASGCTDPDGDNVAYEWQVDSPAGANASIIGANGQRTLDEPGSWSIDLVMTDDGSPPIETRRSFRVVVDDPTGATGSGGAGATDPGDDFLIARLDCSATGGGAGTLFALLCLGMLAVGRRRF